MLYRRSTALNLMDELDESPARFSLSANLRENPEILAERVRSILNVPVENQFKWRNDSEAFKEWRNAVEAQGVLVLMFEEVEPEEVRGVSIFHNNLPVIGINNHETRSSRPFTLIHEFIHILLENGNEEKPAIEEKRSEKEWLEVERFSEKITGAVLMPEKNVLNENLIQTKHPSDLWQVTEIKKLAIKYKVTPLAFATRLLSLRLMSPPSYNKWKDSWNDYLSKNPIKPQKGFATPAQKVLNRNGNLLTSIVIGALSLERITPVEASYYLHINYPHVEELRMFYNYGRPLKHSY